MRIQLLAAVLIGLMPAPALAEERGTPDPALRAAIAGPGGKDGELREVDLGACANDLLDGCIAAVDGLREKPADLGELGQQLQLVEKTGRRLGLDERAQTLRDGIEGFGLEREVHPAE